MRDARDIARDAKDSPPPADAAALAAAIAVEVAAALVRSGDVLTVREAQAIATGIARACGLEAPSQESVAHPRPGSLADLDLMRMQRGLWPMTARPAVVLASMMAGARPARRP